MNAKELLLQAQQGNIASFGKLYDMYAYRVMGRCLKILRSQPVAEEVAHDAWIQAYKNIGQCRGAFGTWMYKIASNCCFHNRRQYFSRAQLFQDKKHNLPSQLQGDGFVGGLPSSTERHYIAKEEWNNIVELLPTMREIDRQMLVFAAQDMANKAIGKELGIKECCVKSRLYRARLRLRKLLCEQQNK